MIGRKGVAAAGELVGVRILVAVVCTVAAGVGILVAVGHIVVAVACIAAVVVDIAAAEEVVFSGDRRIHFWQGRHRR